MPEPTQQQPTVTVTMTPLARELLANVARTAYIGGLRAAADAVAEHTGNPVDSNAKMLHALATEAGKDTRSPGESTQAAESDEARCVRCGCTENSPCAGGCAWVPNLGMVDLCSACVPVGAERLRLTWDGTINLPTPSGSPEDQPAEVLCHIGTGIPAVLTLSWQDRLTMASLLDVHVMDTSQPCTTKKCGISEEELATAIPQLGVAPYGWILTHVHGTDGPRRWWCSAWCAQAAIARGGDELAAADTRTFADDLDARYGPGAADEHAAQMAAALEDGLAAERVYDPAEHEYADEAGDEC